MGNAQGVWILQSTMLMLNALNVGKQMTIADRYGIVNRTEKLNQPKILQGFLNF